MQNIFSWFPRNSEANASEFLENKKKMSPRYWHKWILSQQLLVSSCDREREREHSAYVLTMFIGSIDCRSHLYVLSKNDALIPVENNCLSFEKAEIVGLVVYSIYLMLHSDILIDKYFISTRDSKVFFMNFGSVCINQFWR